MSELKYEDNKEFNEFFDSEHGVVDIDGLTYEASKVLFYVDDIAYGERLSEWKNQAKLERLDKLRKIRLFRENERRIKDLKKLIDDKIVIPFVGAGMTVSCGMLPWTPFLIKMAVCADLYEKEQVELKLKGGEYEEIAEEIVSKMGEHWFNEMIEGAFGINSVVGLEGAILNVPNIASGCVLTTNFDEVLEEVYKNAGMPFDRVVSGQSCAGFSRALINKKHWLLKLHGTSFSAQNRVLTLTEYKSAYGDGCIDYDRELPAVLERIAISSRLLFLGCSLSVDKTLDLFKDVIRKHGGEDAPRHYAILESSEENFAERERFLSECQIFPIWYPAGEHDCVEILTAFLSE